MLWNMFNFLFVTFFSGRLKKKGVLMINQLLQVSLFQYWQIFYSIICIYFTRLNTREISLQNMRNSWNVRHIAFQAWTNWAPNTDRALSVVHHLRGTPIFRARTFCLAKRKNPFDLQLISQIGKRITVLQWILNTIVNISVLFFIVQCNILLFIYLMMSKLIYLLMDWETFN